MSPEGKQIKAGIVGVSGYTGEELLKLIIRHPMVELCCVVGSVSAGKTIAELYPDLDFSADLKIQTMEEVDFSCLDLICMCLPHGRSQSVVSAIPPGVKIVDLSADFRLDAASYESWYGTKHLAPDLQGDFVYGLSEVNRDAIKAANYVACPGCYPTSILIPLVPLLVDGWIDPASIIIDAKSGISGAGKAPSATNIFCNVNENVIPYQVAMHRHLAEIEKVLEAAANQKVAVDFVPQVVPLTRGMLSTIFVNTRAGNNSTEVFEFLRSYYRDSAFIRPINYTPTIKGVVNSNELHFAVFPGRRKGSVIIISAIDNLLKGASGQAVQNMNLMFGWDEKTALARR